MTISKEGTLSIGRFVRYRVSNLLDNLGMECLTGMKGNNNPP